MKAITLIFLFISTLTFAQFVPGDAVRKEHSMKNLDFALNNDGKKIGNGVCYELVNESIKQYRAKDFESVVNNMDKFLLRGYSAVIPGDVVVFSDVIYGSDTIFSHIGIIVQVEPDGFYYANQNVSQKGSEKITVNINGNDRKVFADSKVKVSSFAFRAVKSGNITYYRF